MELVLSIVRCPDAAVPETRRFGGGEVVIGRGEDCGWRLPDPDHHLSRRHCAIAYRGGAWRLTDLSTNGTHLNRAAAPIGKGNEVVLNDGDRLSLGEYEIEVRLRAPVAPVVPPTPAEDPFAPFAAEPAAGPGPLELGPAGRPLIPEDADLDPAADSWPGASRPDHLPATSDHFAPPRVHAPIIPEDFDLDLPAAPPRPPPAAPAAAPPEEWDAPARPMPPPETAPRPAPSPVPPASPAAPAQPGDAALLAAFLEGAGLAGFAPGERDPAALMRSLGAAFRAFVEGLREVLITRATIKSEFRIEQTIIAARGNNPLKFSPTAEDALIALLGRSRGFMAAEAAVRDALEDIKRHELATLQAMQAAVRALLARLDPAALRAEAEAGGGLALVPAQRRARAFELFEQRFAAALADLEAADGAFGRAFARAYEAAARREGERG